MNLKSYDKLISVTINKISFDYIVLVYKLKNTFFGFLKFKDFITLKSTKNNLQMDRIKIFKITNNQNNNKIIGQSILL